MLGMAFAVVSLASVSVFIDWSARGQAALNAWDEMAGLFAFGYHPVSASEWASLNNTAEPICPESDLPGRQLLAVNRLSEAAALPKESGKILTAKTIPVRRQMRREQAPTVIAAVSREDESFGDESFSLIAQDSELPVYNVDFAEIASFEQAAEVEEFTARASEIVECEINLIHAVRAREYGLRVRTAFKTTPTFVVEKPAGWMDLILKLRLRKGAVTPAPVTCGP